MKCSRLLMFPLIVAMLAFCVSAWGQATTSLHGNVTDPTGAAISGAKVTISETATGTSRETTTSSTGAYSFPDILPGTYDLTVTAQGFQTYLQKGLQLMVSLPASSNVRMQVGSVASTVEVNEQAPLLNTTDASLGHTMGSDAIQNLPMLGESMPLLLSLQAGVVYNGDQNLQSSYDTRAGSVNGERSDQNNITLDGVSDNDEFAGYAFNGVLPTTPFSTQEFRVTTSNYGATQGRSAGAQITMVTRSGGNHFHGNLYEFNRNTLGEGNDWFLKQSQIEAGEPNRPEKLVRNVFGGDIGGPFLRNRLFFFFNYQGTRINTTASSIRNIPSSTLSDGIIQYACNDASSCPGGSVTGASGNSYSVAPGYYALSPQQLAKMDPLGIGPSKVALDYFHTYPTPNAPAVLDAPNFAGYRFASPITNNDNWYIGRLDYNINNNHILFLRGTVMHDRDVTAGPFLPGDGPQSQDVDFSKGLVAGYTTVFGPNWVNNFRYGLTRQSYGANGDSNLPWIEMRDLDQDINRTTATVTPVHNFIDTVDWHHGSHNFQFGANILMIRRHNLSNSTSFSDALTNSDWIVGSGFAGTGNALDPAASGYPAVGGAHAYDFPLAAMMGMASEVDARYNYAVTNQTTATPIAQGAPIERHWATESYGLYFQDTWQATRNLSLTFGLNYQLMTPIRETNGQQVEPNVNMGQWFDQRWQNMEKGIGSNQDAVINYAPAGSYWGRSGMYGMQNKNFAPRVGISYTPHADSGWLAGLTGNGKMSIRSGFGMYYANFGPALAMRYDAGGSFGLSTELSNPAGVLGVGDVPRITGMNTIPTVDNNGDPIMQPAPPSTFPVTYPLGSEAIATGIDQSLKTPYSYAMDLSIQRELPGRMVLEVGYVGHLGHRGLALDDIAAPMDLTDPKTGVDYFSAAQALARLYWNNVPMSQITAGSVGSTAAYWADMFGASSSYSGCAAGAANQLQAVYSQMACEAGNETSPLYDMDLGYSNPMPTGGVNSFFNSQFSSLWAWRSMTNSNYHGMQVGLHKETSNGVMFGFNYTYSHSLDIASFAERAAHFLTDSIINAWDPQQMYGPSDFDLRHQINGYWVAQLPFGTGKAVAGHANRLADSVIGGWQLAGTTRWTSGFPFSVFMGYVWPTNWDEMGWANQIKPVSTGTTIVDGSPNVFKSQSTAMNSFFYALPGQSGQRNNIRGEGFLNTDMNLAKSFKITERQSFQFRWQVFNTFNTHRFDVQGIQDEQDAGGFGNYTSLLTEPRTMEFSGVFTF